MLSAEQLLVRATVWLMNEPRYCAFSGLYLMGSTQVVEDVPTACTNGRDEYYGRAFTEKLPDEEVRGVKLHETWHKAGRHMMIYKHLAERDAHVANKAMDYVINLFIVDSDPTGKDVRLPKGGLVDERFRNMDVTQVFNILMEEKNEQGNDSTQAGKGEGGEPLDQHDWQGAADLTAEEQQTLAKEVDEALRQGKLIAARLKANLPRGIEDILAPKVRWEDALHDYVTALCVGNDLPSYKKPNRRFMDSTLIMPTHISETVGRVVIAADMSGSTERYVGKFLAEINALCEVVRPEGVDLIYWDSHVTGHEVYAENSYAGMLTTTKPQGGGGTEVQCVVDYMKQKNIRPTCVIVLTDGYLGGDWGTGWDAPVLWCITTDKIVAPIGKSIYVEVE